MTNYIGCICDVCSETFTSDSDIVVCPDCGTPHHRECWKSVGHCVNSDKHDSGFIWTSPVLEAKLNNNDTTTICPKCNTTNVSDATFCENCGAELKSNTSNKPIPPVSPFEMMKMDKETLKKHTEAEVSGNVEGINYKDMAVYIGPNAQSYIHKFKRMDNDKNYKPFCLSAFLFSPLYFFYRKMWKVGLLSYLLNVIFVALASYLGVFASVLFILVNIFLGFVAIPMYKRQVLEDLKKFKYTTTNQELYYQALISKAGPSKIIVAIMAIFAISSIFSMLFF